MLSSWRPAARHPPVLPAGRRDAVLAATPPIGETLLHSPLPPAFALGVNALPTPPAAEV